MQGRLHPLFLVPALVACTARSDQPATAPPAEDDRHADLRVRPDLYAQAGLSADLSALTDDERAMLPLLIQAAGIMDSLYWAEAWGAPDSLPAQDPGADVRRFFRMNYGPWDRLVGNAPFLDGVGAKPKGARFYPADMTLKEFESWPDSAKASPYTVVARGAGRKLEAIPYHVHFRGPVERAAALLDQCAGLAPEADFRDYLRARARALRTDRYRASDSAWMQMRAEHLDLIIGPVETYEDELLGCKAAHQAYVLVKDAAWSRRAEQYAGLLPEVQQELPVPAAYKPALHAAPARMQVYDAACVAGASNAGAKALGLNLPNDQGLRRSMGVRNVQLKNIAEAKYEKILRPIAERLVAKDQRGHITFDAFFRNHLFLVMAHGLGCTNTLDGRPVRQAMEEEADAVEQATAGALGLFMAGEMRRQGLITPVELTDIYVTCLANSFRSVRYGTGSASAKADLLRFNFFLQAGAFRRDARTGTYRVEQDRMGPAVEALAWQLLRVQGDGDPSAARDLLARYAVKGTRLQQDLSGLRAARIPIEVVFEQAGLPAGPETGER